MDNTTTQDPPESGIDRLIGVIEKMEARDADREAGLERRINDAITKAAGGDLTTPTKTTERVEVIDEYQQRGYTRGDFEVARMLMEGARNLKALPLEVNASDDFLSAYRYSMQTGPRIMVAKDGKPVRAMDSAETGYGLELMGTQYVRDMWMAARNSDSIVGRIREIPMTDATSYIPIDGSLPEMLFVGESTSASATAYDTSKTGSNRVSMTAKKFTIQQIWSAELNEDSIIAYTPFLREQIGESMAQHLGSAYYNGDTTNAGTGNINLDDANPADTKHYLAWDGIRHYWLVDATGQGKDMAAALDPGEINIARGKLNGADDDVDSAVGNINWGKNARDLLLVCDWATYMAMTRLDEVLTVDKYGSNATLVTGELANIWGIPIISPSYATKTEADGKCSTTEASNTKGQITVFNPRGFLGGVRRDVQFFLDRIQRTDQYLIEVYTRRAFTRYGGYVAAGVYDISL